MSGYIEFEAPCCYSIRTCKDTAHYIISLTSKRILKTIPAVRCSRGIVKRYKFYPDNTVALIEHYVSTRGVHHIRILWKPESKSREEVIEIARKALGLHHDQKIVVLGEEVVEERINE